MLAGGANNVYKKIQDEISEKCNTRKNWPQTGGLDWAELCLDPVIKKW